MSLRRVLISNRQFRRLRPVVSTYTFSSSPAFKNESSHNRSKKDDLMDKDSINTSSTENTKSGSDQAAAHEQDAFDPSSTRPEEEGSSQADDSIGVSGGNKEVNRSKSDADHVKSQSPAEASGDRQRDTGKGNTSKARAAK